MKRKMDSKKVKLNDMPYIKTDGHFGSSNQLTNNQKMRVVSKLSGEETNALGN